jgi:hypothetical protein
MTNGAENPRAVSATYQLPASQVITFVGFQGTLDPSKLAAALASVGTNQHMYPAGPHGGTLGCASAKPSATGTSGTICAWATTGTLGVTSSSPPQVPRPWPARPPARTTRSSSAPMSSKGNPLKAC